MDAPNFMRWVEHRLLPTFASLYGPGTELGGATGLKMILIMDNAPYHHKRAFKSFSALKTKKELIEEMIKMADNSGKPVTKVNLPAKAGVAGRESAKEIDLRDTYESSLPNAPDDKDGHTATEAERKTTKFVYADSAAGKPHIPTMEELKVACIEVLNKPNNEELLRCEVQKLLAAHGHSWLWTPPYCPWLQPVRLLLPPPTLRVLVTFGLCGCAGCQQIETFWAAGKNHAAKMNRTGRSMRECMGHLRDGWYGNGEYWEWVGAGKPKGSGPKGGGRTVLPAEMRKQRAQNRFGPKAGVDDWIPNDCCRPANCAGLVAKTKTEANVMIKTIPGISGTVDQVTVEQDAVLVKDHTRDMSDLTGLPREILLGNDTIEESENAHAQAEPGLPRSSMEPCSRCQRLTEGTICGACDPAAEL